MSESNNIPTTDIFGDWLTQGKRPPRATLVRLAEEAKRELKKRSYETFPALDNAEIAVVAAMLKDKDLWRELIQSDCARNRYHYQKQKDHGMPAEDLGDKPDEQNTSDRIKQLSDRCLNDCPPGTAEDIRQQLFKFS